MRHIALLAAALVAASAFADDPVRRVDGYRGIWFTLGQFGEYGDKYSGGLGTYTAKHRPIAVYAPEANKTFFTYGGTTERDERHLLIMVSYFDHATGTVPKPVVVHDKEGVNDPHDNGAIALAEDGHIWVFVSGRGRSRPGFKYRSLAPHSIDGFERISEEEMTYPQPCVIPGKGFVHMFTRYTDGRELYWNTSADGRTWTEPRKLAGMGGHYQVTEAKGDWVYTAFNMHPGGNVDKRTNIYFVKSNDMGATWTAVDGTPLETPLTDPKCAALVRDFQSEGLNVYIKDTQFDADGHPVILAVTTPHHMPGPQGDPRTWIVVHWDGGAWRFHDVTTSTHNYDTGQLWIEGDLWRILAPTERGPQRWGAGGEVALWESADQGATWAKIKDITKDSPLNNGYVRRPLNAHNDFYALWADGDPGGLSASRLYFTDRDGSNVWRLPYDMDGDSAKPELLHPAIE